MTLTATQPLSLPKRRPGRGWAAALFPPLLVLAGFVGLWYLMSYELLAPDRRFLVPPPHRVVSVGFLDWENLQALLVGLVVTMRVAGVGLLAAILIGLAVAIAMSQAAWVERSLYPYAVTLQTIPILALVPLFGFWFGFGFFSRVVVCTMISLFPIIANTLFGLKSIDPALRELFALQKVGRMKRLLKLDLPFALTAVLAGFRISAGLSVIGAIVGDFFFRQGTTGIGILMSLYISRLQSELLYASIILSSLLGIVAFWLFSGISFVVGKRFDRSQA